MSGLPTLPDIPKLEAGYRKGCFTPRQVIADALARAARFEDRNIFTFRPEIDALMPWLSRLEDAEPESLPLFGIPFLVKDNIDVAGMPTTAACVPFAYTPDRSAFVVQRLVDAGAIPIGKTNMDQFATGLVGTRSPQWGVCRNALDPGWIAGGSSAGSAVGVALGLASFSLGTDTAGAGRVPAMLNNVVGLKPSRGLLSMSGIVPACRSLDCPSVFALTAADARRVFEVAVDRDREDPWSRENPFSNSVRAAGLPTGTLRLGVPIESQLEFFGDTGNAGCYAAAVEAWIELGAETEEVDIAPLLAAARLLYDGPWVAERYLAVEDVFEQLGDAMDPAVRAILEPSPDLRTVDAWRAAYALQRCRVAAERLFDGIDALLLPTAPTSYRIEEVLAEPLALNTRMGFYTNFMNLLDLCGVAVPAGMNTAGRPFGVTLAAPAMRDQALLGLAEWWQASQGLPAGATGQVPALVTPSPSRYSARVDVAVCGAHLDGLPLNWQLVERGGKLVEKTLTMSCYRLYALPGGPPLRPGLLRDENAGTAIEVEVWSLPATEFGSFVAAIPRPLGIGQVELESGCWVSGFLCEPAGLEGATDISSLGSWRAYLAMQ